ncbi:MAG: hypothetical protein JRJ12_09910 [Deltaproteobacteria bacterium]|nr:hypothetical protein [Deltaproteobacteria bacterium]MBW2071583.1 hypothetical protein [Deltaproteobacteria bacterium]
MKRNLRNIFILLTLFSLCSGIVLFVLNVSEKPLHSSSIRVQEYPVIVVMTDNKGCRTRVEMRSFLAEAPAAEIPSR